jgi:hypothetical protein
MSASRLPASCIMIVVKPLCHDKVSSGAVGWCGGCDIIAALPLPSDCQPSLDHHCAW